MDKLPIELLPRIAHFLLVQPHPGLPDRTIATASLLHLMQTSKRYYHSLLPTIYQNVCVQSLKRAEKWAKCYFDKLEEAGEGRDDWVKKYAVKKLFFHFGHLHDRRDEDPEDVHLIVPSLTRGLEAGLFDRLTHFSLSTCWMDPHPFALLFGPGQPARQHIQHLDLVCYFGYWTRGAVALFCLEALKYLDPKQYAVAVKVDPKLLAEAEPDWETRIRTTEARIYPSCEHQRVTASDEQRDAANNDYPSFLNLYRSRDLRWALSQPRHAEIAASVFAAYPTSPSPFLNLAILSMQYIEKEELFLIFFTPTFPALKELTLWAVDELALSLTPELHGAMRLSITHDPPGEIIPPEDPEYGFELPDDYQGDFDPVWTPITGKEVAVYPLKPYRGPRLEELDLTCLSIVILRPA